MGVEWQVYLIWAIIKFKSRGEFSPHHEKAMFWQFPMDVAVCSLPTFLWNSSCVCLGGPS
jgi:hypothetical protein